MDETDDEENNGENEEIEEDDRLAITENEAKRKQEASALKFDTLLSEIETAFNKSAEFLKGKKKYIMGIEFLAFTETQNDDFVKTIFKLRQYIAEGETLFDSDIVYENFKPKFDNYKHIMTFLVDRCITFHQQQYTFTYWKKRDIYVYNFTHFNVGLQKLESSLGELLGGLKQAGQYIRNAPRTSGSNSHTPQPYDGYEGYQPAYPYNYPNTQPHQKESMNKLREIGDAQDTIL